MYSCVSFGAFVKEAKPLVLFEWKFCDFQGFPRSLYDGAIEALGDRIFLPCVRGDRVEKDAGRE